MCLFFLDLSSKIWAHGAVFWGCLKSLDAWHLFGILCMTLYSQTHAMTKPFQHMLFHENRAFLVLEKKTEEEKEKAKCKSCTMHWGCWLIICLVLRVYCIELLYTATPSSLNSKLLCTLTGNTRQQDSQTTQLHISIHLQHKAQRFIQCTRFSFSPNPTHQPEKMDFMRWETI